MEPAIREQRIGDHAVALTISNPPMNPLGLALRQQMISRFAAFEQDIAVRCVIITGEGAAFCTGEDLREREAVNGIRPPITDTTTGFGALLQQIESFRAPVIAAINGWCIGGGLELALACDIRIAARSARFVCAGVNVGLLASAYRLPRIIGVGPAKAMLLTGSPTAAAKAEQIGLVAAVHDDAQLVQEAVALAERIASRAPLSVEAAKILSSQAPDLTPAEGKAAEGEVLTRLAMTQDHAEALAAFKAKREPVFSRS